MIFGSLFTCFQEVLTRQLGQICLIRLVFVNLTLEMILTNAFALIFCVTTLVFLPANVDIHRKLVLQL